ncbi:hypothetical protein BV22DRAFT_363787 [Leucogyrophana mollusca]|uniref:Uncharacterized protein n=1 Tax=Leucogyrophana mollusca TaxID=85980 RepID=A0ACB8BKM9_9AGAM|nr:hypothetical protein BV22DRAFT_363787 [Leucogyrophana mollusca]
MPCPAPILLAIPIVFDGSKARMMVRFRGIPNADASSVNHPSADKNLSGLSSGELGAWLLLGSIVCHPSEDVGYIGSMLCSEESSVLAIHSGILVALIYCDKL